MADGGCASIPRRPMTAVFAYIHANYASIKLRDDVKSPNDVSIVGAREFKALPAEEQETWKASYREKMKEWNAWAATEEGKRALAGQKAAASLKLKEKAQVAQKKREDEELRQLQLQLNEARKVVNSAKARLLAASAAAKKHPSQPEPTPAVMQFFHQKKEMLRLRYPKSRDLKRNAATEFKTLAKDAQAPFLALYEAERATYEQWRSGEGGRAKEEFQQASEAEQEATKVAKEIEAKMAAIRSGTPASNATPRHSDESGCSTPTKKRPVPADSTPEGAAKARSVLKSKLSALKKLKPNPKAAKKSRVATAETKGLAIDEAVLKEAKGLMNGDTDFWSALLNLANRPDVAASGKSARELLDALKASNGLVNKAKQALLGAS